MLNNCSVKSTRKNGERTHNMMNSTLCLALLASVMLTAVVIYGVLPPIISSNYVNKAERVISSALSAGNRSNIEQLGDNVAHEDLTLEVKSTATTSDPLLIHTQYGSVRGIYSDKNKVFHGVPYAKPPVGDLRWRLPVDPDPWSPEILDATKIRPGCPQDCSISLYCSTDMSEDCLFLEIYVPENVSTPVPVMVYLHGGSFKDVTCTLPIFDATKLVERSGMIVVLVEFRIGTLGFLVTGQGEGQATGNYGIHDQRQALSWIRANIGSFGGDPDKVTLAGQSSGAQSVLIHMLSDTASQHIRSFIVESPPLPLPYKTSKEASDHGRTFAQILNCVQNNSAIDISCLKRKNVSEILDAQIKAIDTGFSTTDKIEPWGPVIDDNIIKSQALDALKQYVESNKEIKPIICGHTTEEGVGFVKRLLPQPIPPLMFKLILYSVFSKMPDNIDQLYPVKDSDDVRETLSLILTDAVFRCPLRRFVKLLKEAGHGEKVWLYTWDSPGVFPLPEEFAICNGRVCHSAEIPFVFQSFHKISNISNPKDIKLSNILIYYLKNFIQFGNPNGEVIEGLEGHSNFSHGENKTLDGTLIIEWPNAKSDPMEGISQIVFPLDGNLKTTKDINNQRCDAWDKSGYSIFG